jgi:cell division protein ZapE|tara:strand:- start:10565 stop:11686 length:1122 start_codon:yes stop_codon:yes gene_type:complete
VTRPDESLSATFIGRLARTDADPDQHQQQALKTCASLADRLNQAFAESSPKVPWGLARRLRLRKNPITPIRGIYLWGSVGRGKTLIMDTLLEALPEETCRRVHFHRFMLEIHDGLRRRPQQKDPLRRISREISAKTRVLGFDEFHVSDIGDAMILSGLLHALVENGLTLIFTSNTPPRLLYRQGLQRDRFLPAIELIERHAQVVHLDGDRDYRLEMLGSLPTYHVPDDTRAEAGMRSLLLTIDPKAAISPDVLTLNRRQIPIRARGDGVIWFDFEALCEGPRSKVDYAELSRSCHTLLLSGIPCLGADREDAARRLIELIDELYDRRVNVVVSAAAPANALYQGVRLAADFARTASRLHEFQSEDYLASAHRP